MPAEEITYETLKKAIGEWEAPRERHVGLGSEVCVGVLGPVCCPPKHGSHGCQGRGWQFPLNSSQLPKSLSLNRGQCPMPGTLFLLTVAIKSSWLRVMANQTGEKGILMSKYKYFENFFGGV